MISPYGPEVGRRHFLTLLKDIGVSEALHGCLSIGGQQYYVFWEADLSRPFFKVSYSRLTATAEQIFFNAQMICILEAV